VKATSSTLAAVPDFFGSMELLTLIS
jgi:hypothetical protein